MCRLVCAFVVRNPEDRVSRIEAHIIIINNDAIYPRPGRVALSVMCLTTDVCLISDSGVASLIAAQSHTFVEIDHEIISRVILLPSANSFKKGCCQLKVYAQSTG